MSASSASRPRVGAVVVTYRSDEALPGLLRSLEEFEPDADVVVVDAASPGGAPPVGSEHQLIELEANRGFGAACNAGVAALPAGWEYVAFLNPDVRLRAGSLTQLAAAMRARPQVGIATGPIEDSAGEAQPSAWGPTSALRAAWFASGWRLPRLRRIVGSLSSRGPLESSASLSGRELEVHGHVLGGAMVVRRSCWEALGGFDEEFFLYWEDADLCRRAVDAGWRLRVLAVEPIVHDAGTSSTGVSGEDRWGWYVDGASTYAEKHLTSAQRRRLLTALRLGRRLRR